MLEQEEKTKQGWRALARQRTENIELLIEKAEPLTQKIKRVNNEASEGD